MAYILLGHGSEYLYRARPVVPPGCMLVIAEECGARGTLPPQIYEAVQRTDTGALFADPIKYHAALEVLLGRRLRIRVTDQDYPFLTYRLINTEGKRAVGPSGVWAIPSPPGSMVLDPTARGEDRFTVSAKRAGTTYAHSVFPTAAASLASLAPLSLTQLMKRSDLRISQEELFVQRPGIYYHFLCRELADEGTNLRGPLRTVFPQVNADLFGHGRREQFNVVAQLGDWLGTVDRTVLDSEQRRTVTAMNRVVRNVMTRRSASASASGAKELHRLLSVGRPNQARIAKLIADSDLADLNYRDPHDGQTALMIAAASTALVVAVTALLGRSVDLDTRDITGKTAIHFAAMGGLAPITALIQAGANVRATDIDGVTAIHIAAEKVGTAPAIAALAAAGADPSVPDYDGDTPLHVAAEHGNNAAIRALALLLAGAGAGTGTGTGAVINAQNAEGLTPLMVGAASGHVHALLRIPGVNLGIRSREGKTALEIARDHDEDEVVEELEAQLATRSIDERSENAALRASI